MTSVLRPCITLSYALIVSTLACHWPVNAQENDGSPAQAVVRPLGAVTLEGANRYALSSSFSDREYLIDVLRVESSSSQSSEAQQLPVIYVLDGNGFFPLVAQFADWLAFVTNELPSALVVGIGYLPDADRSRTENLLSRLDLRAHDLTPTVVEFASPDNNPVSVGGGGDDLLAFINDDLKPFIAARHAVDPEDQTLVGHSLGGLFVLYALFHEPASFSRYIASSPSIWWDDGVLLRAEASFAESGQDLPVSLFLSVGSAEEERMLQDVAEMNTRLRQDIYPGLDLTFQTFEGESHTSVIPGALMRGLRTVFR